MNRTDCSWTRRLERIDELTQAYPFCRQVLAFYRELLLFQQKFHVDLGRLKSLGTSQGGAESVLFSASLPLKSLVGHFPSFLSLVSRVGPEELKEVTVWLQEKGEKEWEDLLSFYWQTGALREDLREAEALLFFPKAFLQPFAQFLAEHGSEPRKSPSGESAVCPHCRRAPQLVVLRSEGEGAARSLICSLCGSEWRFRRIVCPSCGEHEPSRLPRFRAPEIPHVRLEACDSCHRYLKSVDLSVDGRAVPLVDEIAMVPLDVWAVEKGYHKLEINLIGV